MTNRTRAELAAVLLASACRSTAPAPTALRTAVNRLARACQQFFASNGKSSNGKSSSAKEAFAVASKKLNTICLGAAS